MREWLKAAVIWILQFEAETVLRKHKPKIIAVTGNAGKTSTKDAIFAVIGPGRHVRKNEKSFNSEIGVPLTILGLENAWGDPIKWLVNIIKGGILMFSNDKYPDWLIVEVGADHPGDIAKIAEWLKPDIAVITSIPDIPVHVEFFDSPERLAREKRALAEHMKHDGMLVINGDDNYTKRIHQEFKDRALTFGFGGHNDFDAKDAGIAYENKRPVGMMCTIERKGIFGVPVRVYGALGKPRIYSALAAMAVGELVGVGMEEAAQNLASWAPPHGRMRILEGIRGSVIIDDTYNASPAATQAALDTLKEVYGFKKRIAVLGDMLELGRYSKEAHTEVGKKAAKAATLLVTVGLRARAIAEAAMDAKMSEKKIRQYEHGESARAGKELENDIDANTIVLVKGSQGMRMERTVLEIMAEPQRAGELLVRQDAEWQNR